MGSNVSLAISILAEPADHDRGQTIADSMMQAISVTNSLGIDTTFKSLAEAAWQIACNHAIQLPGSSIWWGEKVNITQLAGRVRPAFAMICHTEPDARRGGKAVLGHMLVEAQPTKQGKKESVESANASNVISIEQSACS